jgi:hypothetical protein
MNKKALMPQKHKGLDLKIEKLNISIQGIREESGVSFPLSPVFPQLHTR